jgi:hypothetical protein
MRHRPDEKGLATAMLVAPEGRHAACLSWRTDTLPCFTLWKNQTGLADGYVTGLEPATNFPNPRSYEESQNRVVPLAPNASVRFDLAIEHLTGTAVDATRSRLAALSAVAPPKVHSQPKQGWSRA